MSKEYPLKTWATVLDIFAKERKKMKCKVPKVEAETIAEGMIVVHLFRVLDKCNVVNAVGENGIRCDFEERVKSKMDPDVLYDTAFNTSTMAVVWSGLINVKNTLSTEHAKKYKGLYDTAWSHL